MTTEQTPKKRGEAITKLEKHAYQGLMARHRDIQRESEALETDHNEVLAEIEGNHSGVDLTGQPPTHYVDPQSWNIMEKPQAPESEASVEAQADETTPEKPKRERKPTT